MESVPYIFGFILLLLAVNDWRRSTKKEEASKMNYEYESLLEKEVAELKTERDALADENQKLVFKILKLQEA